MIRNYLKVAWRNLVKSKGYSAINITGLATGMAVALLIGLWISDEFSFNHYHKNHARLAQVLHTQKIDDKSDPGQSSVVPLADELRTKFPDDIKQLSLTWKSTNILAAGDKKISQSGIWAQPDLPGMLTLGMIKGSWQAFNDPSSVMLSQSTAAALFGNDDPINKTVRVDNKTDLKVAGVYEDLPRNTDFYGIQYLLPFNNTSNRWVARSKDWRDHGTELYVQLNEHADFDKTTNRIQNVMLPHLNNIEEYIFLHPMDKWRLYSDFGMGNINSGRIQIVWLFGIIGVFVLLLACINFMNLSTARSEKRAKEVGIRKAVGSLRSQLIGQFLSESVIVAFLALVVTIGLVQLSLPFFNRLSDKSMSIPWTSSLFWSLILGFTFFTGLLSGSYPAFYLSHFNPVKVLKGTFRAGRYSSLPRKILVVVQFTVSISLIIGTIIIYRQVQFAKDRPVGYNRGGLISVVMNTPELYQHYNALRDELIQSGAAEEMAQSNSSPTTIWSNNNGFDWAGKDPQFDPGFGTIAVTHDFGNTVNWKMAGGRDFSRAHTDTGAFILNESAVKLAGLTDPVGKTMKWLGEDHLIIGVVKDMVMTSPYAPTVPTIFHMQYGWVNMITVKMKPNLPVRESLAKIETVFKKYNPSSPFEYKFIDQEYALKFSDEERVGNLATFFAVLAIFISCLGLSGLASFVAGQRTKEIGVRKVLGASEFNLWKLLSKDFVLLVIVSCLIASPLAWYFLHGWLQKYEYRSTISWWIFAVTGAGALVITLLTVSVQAIKAAIANPVKSLRTE